jgi:hypothetical protein
MSVTTCSIAATAASGGRMTMSTPSPSTARSESVTTTAISTSASEPRSSPVISQSIQTIRPSFAMPRRLSGAAAGTRQAAGAATDPTLVVRGPG